MFGRGTQLRMNVESATDHSAAAVVGTGVGNDSLVTRRNNIVSVLT